MKFVKHSLMLIAIICFSSLNPTSAQLPDPGTHLFESDFLGSVAPFNSSAPRSLTDGWTAYRDGPFYFTNQAFAKVENGLLTYRGGFSSNMMVEHDFSDIPSNYQIQMRFRIDWSAAERNAFQFQTDWDTDESSSFVFNANHSDFDHPIMYSSLDNDRFEFPMSGGNWYTAEITRRGAPAPQAARFHGFGYVAPAKSVDWITIDDAPPGLHSLEMRIWADGKERPSEAQIYGDLIGPSETRWIGRNGGNWNASNSWDSGVANSQVHAIIDANGSVNAQVNTRADSKSVFLGLGESINVRSVGDLRVLGDVTQRSGSSSIAGDGKASARNWNLSESAAAQLSVGQSGVVSIREDIRLPERNSNVAGTSLTAFGDARIDAGSILGGYSDPAGTNSVSIQDNAVIDVGYLTVGRIDQNGGTLNVRQTAAIGSHLRVASGGSVTAEKISAGNLEPLGTNSISIQDGSFVRVGHLGAGTITQDGSTLAIRKSASILSDHRLSGGATLQIEPGASYYSNALDISGSYVTSVFDSFVHLSDRSTFSVAGDHQDAFNAHIVENRITRDGSNLGLLATYNNTDNTTRVVFAPSLTGSLEIDNSGFEDLDVHSNSTVPPPFRSSLVALVHGWKSSATETWLNRSATGNVALSIGERLVGSEWDVATYNWSENAAENSLAPTPRVKANAYAHGAHLASQILEGGYKDVHLIAHSLGGRVIDTANRVLKQHGWNGKIHLTFLDAYTPTNWESFFGDESTWADHYYHSGFTGQFVFDTQDDFPNARNVDMSKLAAHVNPVDSHSAPVDWYATSITDGQTWLTQDGLVPYGFNLSQEAGYFGWENPAELMPPVGETDQLTDTAVILSGTTPQWVQKYFQGIDSMVLLNRSDPAFGTVEVVDDLLSMVNGERPVLETSAVSSLFNITASSPLANSQSAPVWANIELLLDNESNAFMFDYEFPSDANGILSAYINGEVIWTQFEGFELSDGSTSSGLISFDGTLPAGLHSLGFRLDSPNGLLTSVRISNVQSSFITPIPEPSVLLPLFMVFTGALTSRKRMHVGTHRTDVRAKV